MTTKETEGCLFLVFLIAILTGVVGVGIKFGVWAALLVVGGLGFLALLRLLS